MGGLVKGRGQHTVAMPADVPGKEASWGVTGAAIGSVTCGCHRSRMKFSHVRSLLRNVVSRDYKYATW